MAASEVESETKPAPDASKDASVSPKEEPKLIQLVKAGDVEGVRQYLLETNEVPNVYDSERMSPLQHAAYRGNVAICQLLIDHGADVNACKHDHKYSALHFAALSGKGDVVRLLLSHGADSEATNTVGKTPSQIGAFVGNHEVVSLINNYVPPSKLDPAFKECKVPVEQRALLSSPLHAFITTVHVHPVSVLMTFDEEPQILDHADLVVKIIFALRDREMRPTQGELNEVLAFKFHYLGSFVRDASKVVGKETKENRSKALVKLQKKFLEGIEPDGAQEHMEKYIRETIRTFPFPQSALLQNMVATLSKTPIGSHPTAFTVVNSGVNGQRMFQEENMCATCGKEKATKKCSKCKCVSYCDQECQKLDWSSHKKFCARYNEERIAAEKDKKFSAEELDL